MEQLSRRSETVLPIAVLLLAMASVQAGASIAKTMFAVIGPTATVAIRIGLGALILAALLRPWRVRIRRDSWRSLVVYGVSLGVMNLLYYLALDRIPLGIAVALEFTGPLTLAVLSSHRPVDFLWIALAAGGLALLLPIAHAGSGIDPVGTLLALGAGACWALYILSGQKAGADHGAHTVAIGSLISAILIVPVGLWNAPAGLLSQSILLPGLAVAILSTVLPYSMEMIALTRLPTRTFGVLMSLEPAFGALFGLLFLNEQLTPLQWAAIGLIILASLGSATTGQRTVSAPTPD